MSDETRANGKTKAQRLVETLKSFHLHRTKKGTLVFLEPGGRSIGVESKTFIDKFRKQHFVMHGEASSPRAVEDALAYIDSAFPETDAAPASEVPTERVSPSSLLVQLARSKTELFRDEQSVAYADIVREGRRDTLKVRSETFKEWLSLEYYELFENVPRAQAISDALSLIKGYTNKSTPIHKVHQRTAEVNGSIFIDLVNTEGEVVEVSAAGWRIVPDAPVKFVRPKGMLALPRPVPAGTVDEIRPFFNLHEHHFKLLVAWFIAALRPRGPYPILNLQAEHGSGKSTASRFARALVDPHVLPIRSLPREMRDLGVSCAHSHVLAYDNLSGLPIWLSDALCRISTGGGFSTRVLYTDDDEIIFDAVRPIIVNGIDDIATRPDLADRCLLITLPRITGDKRRTEAELNADFDKAAPRIFGALLTALSGAVSQQGSVRLPELPRMADFVSFVTGAERALGWPEHSFLRAYEANREESTAATLDANVVASATLELMVDKVQVRTTPTRFLEELNKLVSDDVRHSRHWPKLANGLTNALRNAAPTLRAVGVNLDYHRRGNKRTVILRKVANLPFARVDDENADKGTVSAEKAPSPPADSQTANGELVLTEEKRTQEGDFEVWWL